MTNLEFVSETEVIKFSGREFSRIYKMPNVKDDIVIIQDSHGKDIVLYSGTLKKIILSQKRFSDEWKNISMNNS